MSLLRAMPFKTADGALNGTIEKLPQDVHRRTDDTLDAYSDVDGPFVLEIVVDPDIKAIAECLPPGGHNAEDAIEICLSIRSVASRLRDEVVSGGLGAKTLLLELDPAQHMGRVDVFLVARLREESQPTLGYAHLKASTLASQLVTTVWFDEPATFSGDSIEIIWRDFDKDPNLEDGHLFAIGLNERPVIYLNEAQSVSPLRSALENKGTHGPMARIRDSVYQQIVHQAWTSILGHCFMEVLRHEDENAETVIESLDDWMSTVLQDWALALVPDEADVDAATIALVERIRETGNEFILIEVPAAIQRKFDTMKGFRGLVREFNQGV
jgi:hypothetical protein